MTNAEAPFGHSAFDRVVERAHQLRVFGRSWHPYFLAGDVGLVCIYALAALVSRQREHFAFIGFAIAFSVMQIGYAAFLRLKARWLGVRSRSFLQDTLLVVLPLYVVLSLLVGNSLETSLDMAGFAMSLGLSFIRVGCFLGGCCYGRPWTQGVLYAPHVLRSADGWRTFTPGAFVGRRVFPMQLAESAANALAFVVLLTWWWNSERATGLVLPVYLAFYGVWRFISDFWRQASVRPRRAGLSEAQWVSLVVLLACASFFFLFRSGS